MENNKLEQDLLEALKLKEQADKQMLKLEWVIGYISVIAFLSLIFISTYIEMEVPVRILLISIGSIIFAAGIHNCLKIEQMAGYYECKKCHHKYIPTYLRVFLSMHIGRTRFMKCPKCGERSWNKKVISK